MVVYWGIMAQVAWFAVADRRSDASAKQQLLPEFAANGVFSDDGTNWGAPPDQAAFTVDSWSDKSVTFTVPSPSGTGGQWHVVPGSTATITVTTALGGTSSPASLVIGSG